MAKKFPSESARKAYEAVQAAQRAAHAKKRKEEARHKRLSETPKPYFTEEKRVIVWQPQEKPPPDPLGKIKCSQCGDRCRRYSKRFIGRVNKKRQPLYQVFCFYCARAIYGTVQHSLHDPSLLAQYPENEAVLALARQQGTLAQYAHAGLVTFKEGKK